MSTVTLSFMKGYAWLLVLTGLFAGVMMAFAMANNETKKQGVVVFTKSVSNITSNSATCSFRVTTLDLGKLKGNQGNLEQDVKTLLDGALENDFKGMKVSRHHTREKHALKRKLASAAA